MTRHGPKGPPLFDVLAPRRREPSAFEVAIQAALAQQPGGDADHRAPAEQPEDERGTAAADAGSAGRGSGSHLVAVELDDEPPLMTAPVEPGPAQAVPVGPGPRIAAFADELSPSTRAHTSSSSLQCSAACSIAARMLRRISSFSRLSMPRT